MTRFRSKHTPDAFDVGVHEDPLHKARREAPRSVVEDSRVSVIHLDEVSKRYGTTWVIEDVDLKLWAGQIHGLCGENGAGKSTTVRIIGGVIRPDRGQLRIDEEVVRLTNAAQARKLGIAVIHQHPMIFPDLTIAENVALATPGIESLSLVRRRKAIERCEELLESLNVELDPRRLAGAISLADQQMVEIAKSLQTQPRALILDEPTASLTPHEVDRLFAVMRDLAAQGTSLLMVNHRLVEVLNICNRVTVLRDGRTVFSAPKEDTTAAELLRHMVGRDIHKSEATTHRRENAEPLLEVDDLGRRGVFSHVSLKVYSGEIVGLAGLVGAGRSDIAKAIFALDEVDEGRITLNGKLLSPRSPVAAISEGLSLIPEDRHHQGLALGGSVRENVAITRPELVTRKFGLVSKALEDQLAIQAIEEFDIDCRGPAQQVKDLSGGNQQKVVLAKWFLGNPKILLLDEPTFGVDVGSQDQIHHMIRRLVGQGAGALLISSDITELLELSDRILVIHEGRMVAEFDRETATEVSIMEAAVGEEGASEE